MEFTTRIDNKSVESSSGWISCEEKRKLYKSKTFISASNIIYHGINQEEEEEYDLKFSKKGGSIKKDRKIIKNDLMEGKKWISKKRKTEAFDKKEIKETKNKSSSNGNSTNSYNDVTNSSEILGYSPNLNCGRIIKAMRAMFICTLKENMYCLYNFVLRERIERSENRSDKEKYELNELEELLLKQYLKLCK